MLLWLQLRRAYGRGRRRPSCCRLESVRRSGRLWGGGEGGWRGQQRLTHVGGPRGGSTGGRRRGNWGGSGPVGARGEDGAMGERGSRGRGESRGGGGSGDGARGTRLGTRAGPVEVSGGRGWRLQERPRGCDCRLLLLLWRLQLLRLGGLRLRLLLLSWRGSLVCAPLRAPAACWQRGGDRRISGATAGSLPAGSAGLRCGNGGGRRRWQHWGGCRYRCGSEGRGRGLLGGGRMASGGRRCDASTP